VLADGRLASGGEDGTIKIWAEEFKGELVVLASDKGRVVSLAGLPDERLAASVNERLEHDDVGEHNPINRRSTLLFRGRCECKTNDDVFSTDVLSVDA
jgi:hypothetical protein